MLLSLRLKVKIFFKRILVIVFVILFTFEPLIMQKKIIFTLSLLLLFFFSSCKVLKKNNCDCPNFSWDVIQKIIDSYEESKEIYVAHNNQRSQPVFMLISKSKLRSLENYLANGDRKIDIFYQKNNYLFLCPLKME